MPPARARARQSKPEKAASVEQSRRRSAARAREKTAGSWSAMSRFRCMDGCLCVGAAGRRKTDRGANASSQSARGPSSKACPLKSAGQVGRGEDLACLQSDDCPEAAVWPSPRSPVSFSPQSIAATGGGQRGTTRMASPCGYRGVRAPPGACAGTLGGEDARRHGPPKQETRRKRLSAREKKCGSEWSISRVLFPPSSSRTSGAVNIPLGSRLLCTSSEPTRRRSAGHRMDAVCCAPVPPYLLLLQMGFAVPVTSLPPRCALTAPFHPCLASPKVGRGRFVFCGTFRRVAPPGR